MSIKSNKDSNKKFPQNKTILVFSIANIKFQLELSLDTRNLCFDLFFIHHELQEMFKIPLCSRSLITKHRVASVFTISVKDLVLNRLVVQVSQLCSTCHSRKPGEITIAALRVEEDPLYELGIDYCQLEWSHHVCQSILLQS